MRCVWGVKGHCPQASIAWRRQDGGTMDEEWSPLQPGQGSQGRGQPARRRKRSRLLILALVALVALLGATLAAPALQRWGGAPWSALLSPFALTRLFAPTPARLTPSPQGCVDGVAPPASQGPDGPISTARGYAGVGKEIALTFDDGP